MSMRPRPRHALVAAIVAIAVTGCTTTSGTPVAANGAPTTTANGEPSGAPTSVTPTTPSKPYLTSSPTLELSDQTTKPGTKLKFGEQAVVPYNSYYAKGLLGITVTVESVKAPDADIDNLPLKDEDKAKLRGKNFFFVRESLVNIDGANFAEIYAPLLHATTKSGGFPGTLLGVGKIEVTGCDARSFAPKDFSTKGAKFDQCALHFGTPSDPIASMAYTAAPYESAATRAVTWRDR